MKLYHSPREIAKIKKPLFLTIGTFDGLHKGHQKVLEGLKKSAKRRGGVSCVLTFKQHPTSILHPAKRKQFITSSVHRLALLDRLGVDACLLLNFTKSFAKQRPEEFVKKYLIKKLHVREVRLGYRCHFGFHRAGTAARMAKYAKKYGFIFKEASPFTEKKIPLSSTQIREFIHRGDLSSIRQYLGRPYSLFGYIVKGKGLGRRLGYPTANLDLRQEILPHLGVYAVTVNILKVKDWMVDTGSVINGASERSGIKGILNFGLRPTVAGGGEKKVVPEVHLFNFKKDLYGRMLEIVFHKKIRDERRFKSISALKNQILLDEKEAKKVLRSVK